MTKRFLGGQGYTVKGKVCGCDLVAVRPGAAETIAVVDTKLGFTLVLVLQSVEWLALAVWD